MSNGLLNASGLITPKVTTDKILLEGEDLKDLLANASTGEIRITAPHALGDFYFSITPYMPEGVLPLNGSEVSRTTYSDLYDYVLSIHNELTESGKKFIVTEEEWQNISIENNGYVPYYSYGVTDGMFRLPRMSGYLKATGEVDEAGNYVAEGLPNITGNIGALGHNGTINGAFLKTASLGYGGGTGGANQADLDASRSNPIYGNSEHVTPETNTLFVGVWALSAFTQVGTANLAEIKEIINQSISILGDSLPLLSSRYDNRGLETSSWKIGDRTWLDGRIYTDAYNKILQRIAEGDTICLEMKESELFSASEFPENFLIDTENIKFRLPISAGRQSIKVEYYAESGNSYEIFSDGWCIQRLCFVPASGASASTLNFLLPFRDIKYSVRSTDSSNTPETVGTDTGGYEQINVIDGGMTTTSFRISHQLNRRTTFLIEGYITEDLLSSFLDTKQVYFKVSHGVDEGRINIEEKLTEFEETAYTRLNEMVEEISKDYVVHVDKQVGELYFSFDNYCPDGVIPLDGRLVSRATYADLWEWVQEKGLVKDDALITTNDENTVSIFNEDGTVKYCSWYGSGDGELTFRMPKINGYLGATGDNTLAGQYIAEGLPNITGSFEFSNSAHIGVSNAQEAFIGTGTISMGWTSAAGGAYNPKVLLDASSSNSIYGNSEHVTPETNTIFVGVWAITASKAAVFDMRDIEEALKSSESYLMNNVPLMSSRWDRDGLGNLGWVKADGSWIDGRHYTGAYAYCVEKLVDGHTDFIAGHLATITEDNCSKFIVDRINKRFRLPISNGQRQLLAAYKEGTQWYNIYSDGWIEQGGEAYNNSTANIIVELLIPFRDTSYTVDKIMGVDDGYDGSASPNYASTWGYTTSSFTTRTYGSGGLNRFRWFAAGYGEVLSVSSPIRTLHLYFKLAHEFYVPAQAEVQEKLDLIDNLVTKTDINLPTLSSRWDSDFAENIGWVKSEGHWLNGNVYRDAYDLMVSRIGVNDKFIEATEGTELTDENADKFLIDTTAAKFRLPLINGERTLVSTYKEGTQWYNLYSDGYIEQGGEFHNSGSDRDVVISFLKPFIDTNYIIDKTIGITGRYTSSATPQCYSTWNYTNSSFTARAYQDEGLHTFRWMANGYSSIVPLSDYNCNNYLYFKLADEVPSTVVNTEQVVADLKQECDDFKNECSATLAQGDFVIETYTDGTSWYRLYNSGWIEQGGESSASIGSISFIKEFANTNYSFISHVMMISNTTSYTLHGMYYGKTTTGISNAYVGQNQTAGKLDSNYIHCWEAKGFIKTTE